MRCLRCALDYPAEAQYCDRCGRALSRPPGSRPVASDAARPEQTSQFMYSTFAPPAHTYSPDSIAPRSKDDDAPPSVIRTEAAPPSQIVEPAARNRRTVLPPSVYLARPSTSARGGPSAPSRQRSDQGAQRADELYPAAPIISEAETQVTNTQVNVAARPARPASQPIRPSESAFSVKPSSRGAPSGRLSAPAPRSVSGAFPDELDEGGAAQFEPPSLSRLKATKVGTDPAIWRKPAPGKRRRLVTAPIAVIVVLVLLAVGVGVLGYMRYDAYTSDIRVARSLSANHQYGEAAARYQQAIDEWPLNSDAKNELATVRQSQSTIISNAQAQSNAAAARQQMYNARITARAQSAATANGAAHAP